MAAASAARFAGFFEEFKALVEFSKQCDCGRPLQDHSACDQDALAWCMEVEVGESFHAVRIC